MAQITDVFNIVVIAFQDCRDNVSDTFHMISIYSRYFKYCMNYQHW